MNHMFDEIDVHKLFTTLQSQFVFVFLILSRK